MDNLNVKHFSASHLMHLRNQEVMVAYDEIIDILEGEEITVDYVAETYNDLVAESETLVVLRNMTRKHHLTKTIREQSDDRYGYFTVFTDTVKTALKSPFEEKRAAAKVLNEWLEPYRKSLSRPLLGVQTTLVKEIYDEVDKVERVAEAINTLDLTPVFNSIKLITLDIKSNITKRGKELSAEKREAKRLKRRGYAKMVVFLNSIEMVLNLNGENKDAYLRYAKEINERLDYYKGVLLSRSTRYKTAAEKEQANSDKGDNAQGDITTTSAATQSNGATTSTPYNLTSSFDEGMDMDMQTKGKTNADSTTTDALNGSETETKNGSDNVANANNATTNNGVLSNKTNGISPADSNTAAHNGANKID